MARESSGLMRNDVGTAQKKGVEPAALVQSLTAKRPAPELKAKNMRLRRELANAKLDLDIVKKSGSVFREGVAVSSVCARCARAWRSRARATTSGEGAKAATGPAPTGSSMLRL